MLTVPHLDREFDYLVSAEQSDDAQPGVRVRVRFHGRLVDAVLLERRSESDHSGKLGWLDRVVSPTRVLTPDVRRLVDAVAARYAGTRADVLRLALPPRHARVEKENRVPGADGLPPATPDRSGWSRYQRGERFLDALTHGRAARAVWQALPGEAWCLRLAEAARATASTGKGVLAIVPDQRDIDALSAECVKNVGVQRVVALSAELGRPNDIGGGWRCYAAKRLW
ncbi:putative primosome assembly protein PriA [Mycobacteroides abscessus subsp. bolletii 1513]|uniref:Putative primosome assembly protein PriA n=1 Tax=Mycobacteroides abscessus subsp. bolletii 1513 TaxID=1299321 RepID=X8DP26_9MYCO|nr:putative primosome assembly protein PriA [Mycobacteroides abscessus subsp. bolletii 1513]